MQQEDSYRGDGLNLYAYCHNNSVYYVDPSGYGRKTIPVTSDNPDVMSIMQSTTQYLDGVRGESVGAVPSKNNFNQWFDSLSYDELVILMSDYGASKGITNRLRLGDRHEYLMVAIEL